jgi:hypothetical protein
VVVGLIEIENHTSLLKASQEVGDLGIHHMLEFVVNLCFLRFFQEKK